VSAEPTIVQVPWGSGSMNIPLPDRWELVQAATPELRSAPSDWPDRLAVALNKPVAGDSLSETLRGLEPGARISLIIEDLTRHSPLHEILPILLRELRHNGVDDSQLEFVIAAGMHPPMSYEQFAEKVGPEAAAIAWRTNPWDDPTAYLELGTINHMPVRIDRGVATSDLRIIVSSVSPHLQAGFGGGYKMFFPGCSELSSIRLLHRFGIKKRSMDQLVGLDPNANAMRRAIDQAGELVDRYHGQTFAIQYLLDGDDLPVYIAAGTPTAAHTMISKQCAVACGIIPEQPADVLITNAYPRDLDLWQCFKAIPNTCWAAREGGVVICLARCPMGANEMKIPRWGLSPYWTRQLVKFIGPSNITALVDRLVANVAGDSQWFIRLATQILQRNHLLMVSPTLVEQGVKFPGISLFYSVEDALKHAKKLLGRKSQRLAVYTAGGSSYPVLRSAKSPKPTEEPEE
jgi:lactate racemase